MSYFTRTLLKESSNAQEMLAFAEYLRLTYPSWRFWVQTTTGERLTWKDYYYPGLVELWTEQT